MLDHEKMFWIILEAFFHCFCGVIKLDSQIWSWSFFVFFSPENSCLGWCHISGLPWQMWPVAHRPDDALYSYVCSSERKRNKALVTVTITVIGGKNRVSDSRQL